MSDQQTKLVRTEHPQQGSAVRDLRRRWKPQKERLNQVQADHPTSIRIHRVCSWLQKSEEEHQQDDDLALLTMWIAFNALYGRWDAEKQQPYADRECWRGFMDRILELDQEKCLAGVLQDHKPLVMCLLEDEYLSSFYWQEPTPRRAGKSKKAMYDARTWYLEGRWTMILDRLIERIYLLRCQLMHGAATHGSKLNRISLNRSIMMMGHLLPAIITVITEYGADEDWGALCYPPLD